MHPIICNFIYYCGACIEDTYDVIGLQASLLRRGLLQSRPWEKYTRRARRLGRGKIKARRERWEGERKKGGLFPFPSFPFSLFLLFPLPIVPRAPVFSLQRSRSRSRFFLWCLLTGASAEDRVFKLSSN